jgi:hypothetical protein
MTLCRPAALLALRRRPQSRPYPFGYERSLRPFLRTSSAPRRRATFRRTLLAAGVGARRRLALDRLGQLGRLERGAVEQVALARLDLGQVCPGQ